MESFLLALRNFVLDDTANSATLLCCAQSAPSIYEIISHWSVFFSMSYHHHPPNAIADHAWVLHSRCFSIVKQVLWDVDMNLSIEVCSNTGLPI